MVEKPKAELKWNKYLHTENVIWQDLYCIPYIVSRETNVQTFQYKIFQRFYPCNYTLSIWYKDHGPICSVCKNATDYIEQRFYYCTESSVFWNHLQKWWYNTLCVTIKLDVLSVLFGISNPDGDNLLHFINYCILYGKWYLHVCITNDKDKFILTFVTQIKKCLIVEKTCEMNNDKSFNDRFLEFYNAI